MFFAVVRRFCAPHMHIVCVDIAIDMKSAFVRKWYTRAGRFRLQALPTCPRAVCLASLCLRLWLLASSLDTNEVSIANLTLVLFQTIDFGSRSLWLSRVVFSELLNIERLTSSIVCLVAVSVPVFFARVTKCPVCTRFHCHSCSDLCEYFCCNECEIFPRALLNWFFWNQDRVCFVCTCKFCLVKCYSFACGVHRYNTVF